MAFQPAPDPGRTEQNRTMTSEVGNVLLFTSPRRLTGSEDRYELIVVITFGLD